MGPDTYLGHICFLFCPSCQAACYVRMVGDKAQRSRSCSDLHSEGFDAGIDAFCQLSVYTGGGSG